MRLVLQCSNCGTVHPVGEVVCATCRESGIEKLRLLFECTSCFRLGLRPSCEVCSRLLSLDPDEPAPDPAELARLWNVDGATAPADVEKPKYEVVDVEDASAAGADDSVTLDGTLPGPTADEESEFELTLEDLPFTEIDDEDLRLDDGIDSVAEDVRDTTDG